MTISPSPPQPYSTPTMPLKKRQRTASPPQTAYQVLRDEDYTTSWDTAWHDNTEHDMVQGTYTTLAEANEAAESNLLDEYNREDFDEEYEVTRDEEGLVSIHAVGMEGVTFDVRVVKIEVQETRERVWVVARTVLGDEDEDEDEGHTPAGKEIVSIHKSEAGAEVGLTRYVKDGAEGLPDGVQVKTGLDGLVTGVLEREGGKVVVVRIEEWGVLH